MKKRIVCVLLTLIMLVSLVPATALTASAATRSTSEAAITVLKQMEGYDKDCDSYGYVGYGTKCPEKGEHGIDDPHHVMYEKEADKELRKALTKLDEAVSGFASKNSLSLSQGQHDALVLFSFENGTAWTTGTGEFQTAVKSGATGSKFLNAICLWESSTADDYRRMVEANMYLNGAYSSSVPSRFVHVVFEWDSDVKLNANKNQYFDAATPQLITLTPVKTGDVFLGWYRDNEFENEDGSKYNADVRVSHITTAHNGKTLYARWQNVGGQKIQYTISKSSLLETAVYSSVNGGKVTKYANIYDKEVAIKLDNTLNVVDDKIDENGVRWAKIADADGAVMGWVKVKGTGNTANTGSAAADGILVTVTNTYVNIRESAKITSAQKGTFHQGDKLYIVDTKNGSDGFLWGQVAKSEKDGTIVGWVALMYTDYESVKNSSVTSGTVNNSTVVATAIITHNGYVNLRSDAGTHNQIVGSLANGFEVDLYETKFVNGVQWGRCSSGWFCLIYADVTRLVEENSIISDVGFANYVFTGDLDSGLLDTELHTIFRVAPDGEFIKEQKDKDGKIKVLKSVDVTFSNLINANGATWVKTSYGWIEMSQITMDVAKFYVTADTLTVRENAGTTEKRVDVLVKGTEFDVSEIVLLDTAIWGKADKVGEGTKTYVGWVNLENKSVSRNGAPTVDNSSDKETTGSTGKIATVINTESVRVRITGATYGAVLGSLSRGTTAAVLEEKNGWYNLDIDVDGDPKTGSWVYGQYLEVTTGSVTGSTTDSTTGAVLTGKGIVANTYGGVNVRTGAGTGNASVGKLLPGTVVEILEVKTHGASKWGRTAQGWVCMDYITMIDNYVPEGSVSSGSGSSTSTNTTSTVAIYTGVTNTDVDIYKEASVNAEIVRQGVPSGYPVTMHEILTVTEITSVTESGNVTTTEETTSYWARVNEGYIMDPENNITLTTADETTYTVTGSEILNVREYPGADQAKVHQLKKGDRVIVNQYAIKGNNIWGHIETDIVNNTLVDEEGNEVKEYWAGEGWVSLAYMTKGAITIQTESNNTNNNTNTGNTNTGNTGTTAPIIGSTGNTTTGGFVTNTSGYKYTGKVINTNELRVRPTASTTGTPTTTLKNGAALVIYETTISEGMAWGRCDAGWVYLYYVDLTPASNGAVDARVVYNDNTIVYTDMNCSGVAGTYSKMSVIDIYEIVGKMARTEMGWVNTDNLL